MGDIIKRRLVEYLAIGLMGMGLLFGFGLLYATQWEKSFGLDERKIRVDYNSVLYKIEAIRAHSDNRKTDYSTVTSEPFTIVDINGIVLYSQYMNYSYGEQVNLHTISLINPSAERYIVPVICDGRQFGTLLLQLDAKNYRKPFFYKVLVFSPLFLGSIIIFTCLCFAVKLFIRDILLPVGELHEATRKIMRGNYTSPVVYDYDGSIGTLCHDFELMRSELQESSQREKTYREKETLLLACISHDLKTPLASITGYVEGILYDIAEGKEEIKEYAGIILQKANGLNQLINDILEHSKAQLNQFSIQKEEVYSEPFFLMLCKELEEDISRENISFTYDPIPGVLLCLDPLRITQVIRNLIDNSVKYRKNPCKIHVSFQLRNNFLAISVEDNGIGISAADLPFLFDAFYRGDKARTQGIAGSGLGLNIAKYIIEQHGGKIECDSILGSQTTMVFSLPAG
jgi:Signal transduction histidine kinase